MDQYFAAADLPGNRTVIFQSLLPGFAAVFRRKKQIAVTQKGDEQLPELRENRRMRGEYHLSQLLSRPGRIRHITDPHGGIDPAVAVDGADLSRDFAHLTLFDGQKPFPQKTLPFILEVVVGALLTERHIQFSQKRPGYPRRQSGNKRSFDHIVMSFCRQSR